MSATPVPAAQARKPGWSARGAANATEQVEYRPNDTARCLLLARFLPAQPPPSLPTPPRTVRDGRRIVGGGLTGCACAVSFAAAGIKVVVLEADRVGSGATQGSAGLIREDFDSSFHQSSASLGLARTRSMWQAMRPRLPRFCGAALRRLAHSMRSRAAGSADAGSSRSRGRQRCCAASTRDRREAGFDHTWMTSAAVSRLAGVDAGGAIRTHAMAM